MTEIKEGVLQFNVWMQSSKLTEMKLSC